MKNALRSSFIQAAAGAYGTTALKAFFTEMHATNFVSYKGHPLTNVPTGGQSACVKTMHDLFVEYTVR